MPETKTKIPLTKDIKQAIECLMKSSATAGFLAEMEMDNDFLYVPLKRELCPDLLLDLKSDGKLEIVT